MHRPRSRLRSVLIRGAAAVLIAVLALVLAVRLTLGGGEPFPDASTTPTVAVDAIETVARLPFSPGNVAVSNSGRVFFNIHPFTQAERFTDELVFELVDTETRPFGAPQVRDKFVGVLGLTADNQDRLWMIAPAGLEDRPTRLLAFDLQTDQLVLEAELDAAAGLFSQDLRVAPDGNTVYLADTGAFFLSDPALVVFDVATQTSRRVLEGHPSLTPQEWQIRTADGPYKIAYGLVTFAAGVDGIAVSHDGQWLYYATMNHSTLFRIPTAGLLDANVSKAQLADSIEAVGPKPLSDGIEIDARGNVYITDVENGGIARLSREGELTTLTKDPAVTWADAVTLAPNGDILFTDSEIPNYIDPLLRPPARQKLDASGPHAIYRFAPPPS